MLNNDKITYEIINSSIYKSEIIDMPVIDYIISSYKQLKPFNDKKIAFAHVLVPNTLPMIVGLLQGGVKDLLITNSKFSKVNEHVIELLTESGLKVELNNYDAREFDYAIDVGASFIDKPPKFAISEVTRSGILKFLKKDTLETLIINTDNSTPKLIETFLGNPRAILRGIKTFLGNPDEVLADKSLAIIGFGKIGRGLARLFKQFCSICVFDINQDVLDFAKTLGFESYLISNNKIENSNKISEFDIIMTCTGFENVITSNF